MILPNFIRPLNGIQYLTLAMVVCIAVGFIYGFRQIQHVQHHQNDALHSIICRVQTAQLRSPNLTEQQKIKDVRFWSIALRDAHLTPCS